MAGHKIKRARNRRGQLVGGQRASVAAPPAGMDSQDVASLVDRDLTVRHFCVRAASVNEEERSVEAVLSTEAPARIYDYDRDEVIDEVLISRGATLPKQIVMLEAHARWSLDSVLGSIRNIRVESGNSIVGQLNFAAGDQRADSAWNKVRQGHLTDVSVGYRVSEYTDIPRGTTGQVNGRTYTAGDRRLRVSTKWQPREASLVPIGADEFAKVRQAMGAARRDEKELAPQRVAGRNDDKEVKMTFEQWLRSRGIDPATLTDERRAELQVEFDAAVKDQSRSDPPAKPADKPAPVVEPRQVAVSQPDAETARAEGVRAERARVARIRELAGNDLPAEVVERAIADGWDEARASREFLEAYRGQRSPAVTVVRDNVDGLRAALTDAVLIGTGYGPADEPARRAAEQFRGIGLQDLGRQCVLAEGQRIDCSRDELFKRAISTNSFTEILADSAHKSMRGAYDEWPSTFLTWAGEREVANFKQHRDLRLSEFSSLVEIGDGGEFESAELSEARENYQAATRGIRFALTRKTWINDDLSAFMQIPVKLARTAKRDIDRLGYTLLVSASGLGPTMNEDSQTLFYASRTYPNYLTGATSVLGDAGLSLAKTRMRKVRDLGANTTLNITPRFLLVPPELEHTALKLVRSQEIFMAKAGTTDATTYLPSANIHMGTLQVIVEPQLSGATNGTTAWYLIADSRMWPTLVAVYLRGNRTPVLERSDPPNVLGIGWRFYHDIGVAAIDWRGIDRSAGA